MLLELEHIDKTFHIGTPDEAALFSDFHYAVSKGQFISVIGSNGSGKTTLLNLICGSCLPERGRILFCGSDITQQSPVQRARRIARVFQDPKAGGCGSLTILENLALADHKGRHYGLAPAISKKRVEQYRALLKGCGMGLEDRLSTKLCALSGGQRQALALITATMNEADLLLLDEHTAALDPKSSETIMELTDRLVRARNLTAIMITHNLRHAAAYGDRLTMLHEGNVVLDVADTEKAACSIDDLLQKFNSISIECGN